MIFIRCLFFFFSQRMLRQVLLARAALILMERSGRSNIPFVELLACCQGRGTGILTRYLTRRNRRCIVCCYLDNIRRCMSRSVRLRRILSLRSSLMSIISFSSLTPFLVNNNLLNLNTVVV